jgi:putative phage-type endonuclease
MSSKYQQTIEWVNARCGCLTASMAGKVVPRQKSGKPYAAYAEALQDVLIERITGAPVEHFTTAAMQWGTEHEDDARAAYEEVTGTIVLDAPFVKHPTIPFFGASPDGFLDDGKGLLEIKCPCSSTHLARVREGIVPPEYRPQMCVQLLCTGREYVDFVDYDPRFVGEYRALQLFIVRFRPEAEELDDVKQKCLGFLAEVDSQLSELKQLAAGAVHV